MSHIPASAYDIDSVLARLARAKSERRSPLRPADREEPKMGLPEASMDADMVDVVQKFEQVYARPDTEPDERQPELAERASAVLFDPPVSLAHDIAEDFDRATAASSALEAPAILPLDAVNERFELPHIDAVTHADESHGAAARVAAGASTSRGLRAGAVAGACGALVIGTAIGYLLAPDRQPLASRAQIEASQHGGTQLRMDYTLPQR